jgi:uncharacterized membrane protein YiaA
MSTAWLLYFLVGTVIFLVGLYLTRKPKDDNK